MPGWKYITLCALFVLSLVLIGIAWGAGIGLHFAFRGGHSVPASIVFVTVAIAAIMTLWFFRAGLVLCTVVTCMMVYRTVLAAAVFSEVGWPSPGVMQ